MPAHVPPHESVVGSGSRQRPLRLLLPAATACCLLFVFLPLASSAQSRFVTAGDKAYESLAYAKAIGNYERAAENAVPDSAYARKLAKSYMNVRDFRQAEVWYARVVTTPNVKPIDYYDYAQALRANGKYGEADKWLRTYELQNTGDSRGKRQANASTYASKLSERAIPGCIVKDLASNTAQADMGVAYYANQVVFASSRTPDVAEFRRHTWDGQPFLDLYSAPVNADGDFGMAAPLSALNTKYHESNACFTPDTGMVWFTRNNYSQGKKGRNGEGVVNLKIYSRTRQHGTWVNEQPFPFNSDVYSVGHPCLSADGNTMYFTSDKPGGVGGTDIWKTVKSGTTWSTPVCLGTEVNTEGDEMFPFIGKDGTFAFASDGQPGLGGLDILIGKMRADGPVIGVKNPGAPLNSGHDDFALVLDGTLLKGYFTSDRPGGKGGDDIYMVDLEHPLGNSMRVEGIAYDRRSKQPMPGATITMKDTVGNVVASATTGPDGSYTLDLEPARTYDLAGMSDGYRPAASEFFSGPEADTVFKRDLRLAKYADVMAWMHVTNARTGEPLADVMTQAIDVPGGNVEVIDGNTNAMGDLRQPLQGRAIDDSLVFRVRLTKQGFFPKKGLFLYTVDDRGEVAMHQIMDLAMEPIEIGAEVGKAININPIYFDLGKWNIRPDAANELDKVVTVMNENPTMEIELGSHTDSRGSDKANMALSDKRAKSSAAYIMSKGIPKERIKGKGYGESKLLNDCGNGSNCIEEQHQLNRRTEFIITKM
jgi:outer membrane protein OmpA-like peptidoglycan-associated protein